jgi:deoxycytidine triphosphate deaminase
MPAVDRASAPIGSDPVILSDATIREELAAGRIIIDPLMDGSSQPSSVDLRIDRYFRVFRNDTTPFIDPKLAQEDLTELVEVKEGNSFILHPGEFVLASTLERVALPSDVVGRLEGKALSLDTEVPTPFGWTTLGSIEVGDIVFDHEGEPTRVVAATALMLQRPCREVVLSDGTSVVADLDHEWRTLTKGARRRRRANVEEDRSTVVSTRVIESTLWVRSERNHHVPLAGAAQYPQQALPIDPYVLGIWLGDGTSTAAEVTTGDDEILEEIRRRGYAVRALSRRLKYRIGGTGHTRDATTGRYARNGSLSSRLRDLGLWGDKHVPELYLRSSVEQRQDLLAGLMDSDGYVDVLGRCEFVSTNERLADATFELVASLGLRPTKRKKRATLNGVDCGPCYQVKFTPDRPVFRLSRKRDRQKTTGRFHQFRAVADVREVPSVPVRCIEVAAPSGLFLVTRAYVPTHNSSLGRLGLLTHATAGFVDSGWDGHLTLELSNVATLPIAIYPEMKIGQISFMRMTTPAEHPYGSDVRGSKYQGQRGPTPSRYYLNFRDG